MTKAFYDYHLLECQKLGKLAEESPHQNLMIVIQETKLNLIDCWIVKSFGVLDILVRMPQEHWRILVMRNDQTLIISEATKGLYTLTTQIFLTDVCCFWISRIHGLCSYEKKTPYSGRNYRTSFAFAQKIGLWPVTSIARWAHEKPCGKATRGMRHFNNFIREVELIDLFHSNSLYT